MADDGDRIRIECKDCSFERFVDPDDDTKPSDVVIEHGQRTGHTVSISKVDDEDD